MIFKQVKFVKSILFAGAILVLASHCLAAQNSWQPMFLDDSTQWRDIKFVDGQNGLMSWLARRGGHTEAGLMRTTDAGETWETIELETWIGYENLVVGSPRVVWAWTGAGDPSLLHSTDGGLTWVQRGDNFPKFSDGQPGFTPDAVTRFPDGRLVAVGRNLGIVISSDSGKTWTWAHVDFKAPGWQRFYDVAVVDSGMAVAVGGVNGQILAYSYDGGQSWEIDSSKSRIIHSNLQKVDFADRTHGVTIDGFSNTVYTTSNGGDTWLSMEIPDSICMDALLVDVAMPAPEDIRILGRCTQLSNLDSRVLRFRGDSGTWTVTTFPGVSLDRIVFSDASTGYVAGTGGVFRWRRFSGVESAGSVSDKGPCGLTMRWQDGNLHVATDSPSRTIHVSILDVLGRRVGGSMQMGREHGDVAFEHLPSGMYICMIFNESCAVTRWIVIP